MTDIPATGLRRAVYLYIQKNPGSTSHDVVAGFPDEKPGSVVSTLSHLHRDGFLSRQKKNGALFHYFIAERAPVAEPAAEPAPLSDYERARFEQMKIDLPDAETKLRAAEDELFEAGALLVSQQEVHAQGTKRLQARIQQLEQWRDAAIARYPDLDVDPALLAKARDIAIRTSDITTALADDILAGEWDQTPIMRATLEALKATYIQGD